MRPCISLSRLVCPSIHPSVHPSFCLSVRPSVHHAFLKYCGKGVLRTINTREPIESHSFIHSFINSFIHSFIWPHCCLDQTCCNYWPEYGLVSPMPDRLNNSSFLPRYLWAKNDIWLCFLVANKRLYIRVCPSVGLSVVRPLRVFFESRNSSKKVI